jgi:DNA polymerase III subunit gamma/tau
MSLNIKHRPRVLKSIVGNTSIVRALIVKMKKKERPHVYLFTGPPGCGKTTFARVLARKVGAIDKEHDFDNSINYREYDAADFRGIDMVRDLKKTVPLSASTGGNKAYLLDECHMLTQPAQEALLKTLEHAPNHVYFFLATTEPQKLKASLKRRCASFNVQPLTDKEMLDFLTGILKKEGKKVPTKILKQIGTDSLGSPGQALMLLDTIIDLKKKDMAKVARLQAAKSNAAVNLAKSLFGKASWQKIAEILSDLQNDGDIEGVRRMIMKWCRSTLLKKGAASTHARAYLIMSAFQSPFYDNGYDDLVLACYESLYGAEEG